MKQFLYILAFAFSTAAFAQQESILFNIQNNAFVVNPGAAGYLNKWALRAHYRQDWARFSGSAYNQTVTLNGKIKGTRLGVGGGLVMEGVGYQSVIGGRLGVSYNLPLQGNSNLGIGFGTKISQLSFQKPDIRTAESNDPAIMMLDNQLISDIDLGAHYTSENIFGGLALNQLAQITGSEAKDLNPIINLYGGYKYAFSDTFKLEPSLLIRSSSGSTQLDFNVRAYFLNEQVFVGTGIRVINGTYFNGMLGLNLIESLHLAYSYDFGGGDGLQRLTRGAHEIMLGWDFNWKKPVLVPELDEDVNASNPIMDKAPAKSETELRKN